MDRVPQPVKDPLNLVRAGSFSLERRLSHIDPEPEEESEPFVRPIYQQRHIDGSVAMIRGAELAVSFMTVAEMRQGAVDANWSRDIVPARLTENKRPRAIGQPNPCRRRGIPRVGKVLRTR